MDYRLFEIGVKFGKGALDTIRWCCRSVCSHPFLAVFLCFLLFLYRSFPFIFSLLVAASPVLVCTGVLLGILLSYGEPNIPEIEIEDRKTDEVVSTKAKKLGDVDGFSEKRRDGLEQSVEELRNVHMENALDDTAPLIEERSREVLLSDGEIGEGSRDLGDGKKSGWYEEGIRDGEIKENHFAPIAEEDEEDDEQDGENSEEAESFGSEKVNVDSLDSPPRSPWTRVDEVEEDDDVDSGSDRAESSSPDASMAQIMPMLDELHPLLDEGAPQPIPGSPDSSDASSERSSISSHESDDERESHQGLDVSDNENEDAVKDEEEEHIKAAITWTEEDQKKLMELQSSEIERNQRLENLIMRRNRDQKLDNGIENPNGDVASDDDEDEEDGQEDKEEETGSHIAWTEEDQKNLMELRTSEIERNQWLENIIMRRSMVRELNNEIENDDDDEDEEDGQEDKEEESGSQIAWTEEDQKNLMELRTSEIERNQRLENIIMRRSMVQELNNEIEKHDDDNDDGEDEEDGQEKEEEAKSPIAWTEEDQKNVMDLGWSEIERNQRLENLIMRRRARKNIGMLPERSFADLESYDLQFNIAPISTRRRNPFDLPDDSYNESGLPPIPGSAPSVLSRRNPFDIPYDSSEEKPDLLGDEFQEEFTPPVQPKELIFRRYESVSVRGARPSRFARQRQEEEEMKMRPYFVPEQTFSEESSYSQFQRQSSELSDSKVSSVPETDSISSLEDLENRKPPEEDFLEVEANSGSIEVIEEYRHQEAEPISIVEHVVEHVRHGSESSEEEDSIELGQVENRDAEVCDIHFQSQEIEDLISDAAEQRYSSDSSSSSLSDVGERVFIETGVEGFFRDGFAGISARALAEHTALTTTSTVVTETPYQVPVYDSSPHPVSESLPSPSSSTDMHPVSDPRLPPALIKRTVSPTEKESEVHTQEIAMNVPHDIEMLAESSITDSVDESRSINVESSKVHENYDKGNATDSPGTAIDELQFQHLNEAQASTISHHDAPKIVEEVDEIKEIDGLLSELDHVGDFGNNQWASSLTEFEKHIDSAGESLSPSHQGNTSTTRAVEVNLVEGNKIEDAMRPESSREAIQVEKNIEHEPELQTSNINTAENITVSEMKLRERGGHTERSQIVVVSKENEVTHAEAVDSFPEKAGMASLGTELLTGDTSTSYQVPINAGIGFGMPKLEAHAIGGAKEIEKPIILKPPRSDQAVGETPVKHSGIHTSPAMTSPILKTSVPPKDSNLEGKIKQPDSIAGTLPVVESGNMQGTSLDSNISAAVLLENTASPLKQLPDGNKEKQLTLSLDEGSVEIKADKEKVDTFTPEKPAKDIKASNQEEHSTVSTKGKGKLSKHSSSSLSSSSSSSSSESDKE